MNRQAGIELLRGILMLMIVLVHLTGNGVLKSDAPIAFTEPNWLWANLIDAICYPAVNTFVLISGYFGIRLSLGRVLKLDIPVIIYSVSLFVLFGSFSIGGLVSSFIPILSKEYWFLTAYFLLMLLSPFLNAFLDSRNQRQLKMLLFWALLLFVIMPSFSPFCLSESRGMDVINFSVLYIVGRSLACFNVNVSRRKSVWLYIASTLIVFALTVLFAYRFDINSGWKSMFYAYNSVFVYLQAIGLFFLFKQFHINDNVGRVIKWVAPSFFFVYIIHSCPVIADKLYFWISSADYYYSEYFVLHTIIWAFIIFVSCIFIDIVFRRGLLMPVINKCTGFIQFGIDGFCNKVLIRGSK